MLELIEIENVSRHNGVGTACGQRMFQPLIEKHAIGQTGKSIVQRHVACTISEVQHVPDMLAESVPVEGLEQERCRAGHQRVLESTAGLVSR